MNLNEVAPPSKKHERMVKHIKKSYKKDGKLTKDEKSIAYATAWKNYNKKSMKEDIKTELLTKAQERHKKAKSFKQFRRDTEKKPLKKGEVRKLVDGKWVSNMEEVIIEGKRPGLWANIHAKRKRGEKKSKPGDKDYPKTLNIESKSIKEEKSCPEGQYYCYDDKKCKPIPEGMKVGKDGMLVKEMSEKLSDIMKGDKEYDLTNARERMIYNRLKKAGKNPLIKKVTEGTTDPVYSTKQFTKFGKSNYPKNTPFIIDKFIKNRAKELFKFKTGIPLAKGMKTEGSLHKWFKGSKSKDGKGGWVNVVTGGTCASDEPGEGTPKCVSSAKRASMTKAERLSAARRKKKADPNQQQKSGAAKPTYVRTDKPKKKTK